MKTTILQLNSTADKVTNLSRALELIEQAIRSEAPDLIVLPEMSAYMASDAAAHHANAEAADGRFGSAIAAAAAQHAVNLCCSFIERRENSFFNSCFLFARDGGLAAQYSKIHRFDAVLPDGVEIRESAIVERGDQIIVVNLEGVRVGLAICYDLRFPELFRIIAEQGADVILLPSAFTHVTGSDHWEPLLRARAIDTQCYIVAPNQVGLFANSAMSWGHSMIVDPWGIPIAQATNRVGFVSALFDLDFLRSIRIRLPIRDHHVLIPWADRSLPV